VKPLSAYPASTARALRAVFTDIDDTLTRDGRLPADAYAAVERLSNAGIAVVPITGRPAGWCDMIARFWPVAGVVGENGAFYFAYDPASRQMRRSYVASETERESNREKLTSLGARILKEVPGSAISADQAYREADLAIDFCEDVPPLPKASIDRIVQIFEDAGASAKVSSIHVNGWFGQYDKLSMTRRFVAEIMDLDLEKSKDNFAFCGDSPNDAPMFRFFPHAVGVANVKDFPGLAPTYVAEGRGGAGFVEFADLVLDARASAI
jgi:HAD superfamily hydrolase (TIGR01484 family)